MPGIDQSIPKMAIGQRLRTSGYEFTMIRPIRLAIRARSDMVNIMGRMPFRWSSDGHRDVTKLLLAHGADPNSKDKKGETPLDFWPELADIVKEVEAEVRQED